MAIEVSILTYTPSPELMVAVAARACIEDDSPHALRDRLSAEDVRRLVTTVIVKGHHSVLEHVTFTIAVSGVSRVLTHQLVRHRMASYSQLSQQRSDASDLAYAVPPEIRREPELRERYASLMELCREFYIDASKAGVSKGSARYVLPSGFETRIVVTMNARSLFNLLAQRECAAEEWEFRQVATQLHRELLKVAPTIFALAGTPCETTGLCLEGEVGQKCARAQLTEATIQNTRSDIHDLLAQSLSAR